GAGRSWPPLRAHGFSRLGVLLRSLYAGLLLVLVLVGAIELAALSTHDVSAHTGSESALIGQGAARQFGMTPLPTPPPTSTTRPTWTVTSTPTLTPTSTPTITDTPTETATPL